MLPTLLPYFRDVTTFVVGGSTGFYLFLGLSRKDNTFFMLCSVFSPYFVVFLVGNFESAWVKDILIIIEEVGFNELNVFREISIFFYLISCFRVVILRLEGPLKSIATSGSEELVLEELSLDEAISITTDELFVKGQTRLRALEVAAIHSRSLGLIQA